MKKFMIALAATLGLGAAATAPAQAGSNFSVSAGFFTSAPIVYVPAPIIKVPVYHAPIYVDPFSNFGFGIKKSFNSRNNFIKRRVIKQKRINRKIRNLNRRSNRLGNVNRFRRFN